MGYIAKIALPYGGRFIPKGGKVPDDYKRLRDGIKRGWIEVTGDPAAVPPAVIAETEAIAPEDPPEYVEPVIEDLDYLNPMAKESLLDTGIIRISQLEGLDIESLDELPGIGLKLAEKLIADYAAYVDHLGNMVPVDTEYESMPPEDENAESETEATGEDESPQDD